MKKVKNINITSLVNITNLIGFQKHSLNGTNIACFEIPRNLIKNVWDEKDIDQSGIYLLLDDSENQIYVGQAANLIEQLNNLNNSEKKFNRAIGFVSNGMPLDSAVINHLESAYINKFMNSNSWNSINIQRPQKLEMDEFIEPKVEECISKIDEFLIYLKIDLNKINEEDNNGNIFYYKEAKVIFENGNFILMKNSKIINYEKKITNENKKLNLSDKEIISAQKNWLNNKKIAIFNDEFYVLIENIIVSSPSFATKYVNGSYSSNGWINWKNQNGKTLKDIYQLEESQSQYLEAQNKIYRKDLQKKISHYRLFQKLEINKKIIEKILYDFLVLKKSYMKIEKEIYNQNFKGWLVYDILKFLGINNNEKGTVLEKDFKNKIKELNIDDLLEAINILCKKNKN